MRHTLILVFVGLVWVGSSVRAQGLPRTGWSGEQMDQSLRGKYDVRIEVKRGGTPTVYYSNVKVDGMSGLLVCTFSGRGSIITNVQWYCADTAQIVLERPELRSDNFHRLIERPDSRINPTDVRNFANSLIERFGKPSPTYQNVSPDELHWNIGGLSAELVVSTGLVYYSESQPERRMY